MPLRPPRIIRRLLALFAWDRRDRDMQREMAFHLESLRRDYVDAGLPPADAARAAARHFGNTTRLKERGHDERTSPLLENLVRDVRHTMRGLRRSPGFAITVILTLALGIGGNAAIFSVVDQLLLRPLPYPQGDRLVVVREVLGATPVETTTASPANWLDWQRDSRTLAAFAAWRPATFTLTGIGDPMQVNAQLVSAEFFPLLGVAPLLGRAIEPDDDRPNAKTVAVLSHDMWQRQFGRDPGIIGRTVQLSDQPYEVVGVMPPQFRFVSADNDLWTAMRLNRQEPWRQSAGRFIQVIARLAPDATLTAARAEMTGIAERLAAMYAFNKRSTVRLIPLRESLTRDVYTSLMILYGAVGVLLSVACFNVANLLLARAASRRRELVIRTSLGAGRRAIVQQLLIESLILAGAGGVVGIAIARWSLAALMAFAPPDLLGVPELLVDRRVLFYALALSLVTGLAVGLVPALLVTRRSLVVSIRESIAGAHSPRVRQLMVIGQVAMTVILLAGAGLLVRTIVALDRVDNGVDTRDLLTMTVGLPAARYPQEKRIAFYGEATAALRTLPGVSAAAAADTLPIVGRPRGGTIFHRLGTPKLPMSESPFATIRIVTPGLFETLRVPVLRGREFSPSDHANADAGFIVNDAFVRAHLKDVDPLTVSMSVVMSAENPYLPIVGVVGDVNEGSVRDGAHPTIYYNYARLSETSMTLFVRAANAGALANAAVAAVRRIDPGLAIARVRTFEDALSETLARERLSALVTGAFAIAALLLVSLGVYGLLAFLVAERTKEIGIRIALGAQLGRLTGGIIGGGLTLVGIGAAVGIAGSLVLLRSFGTLLFGVTPYDALTYASVLLLLVLVGAIASYVPARRAARIEPLATLRE